MSYLLPMLALIQPKQLSADEVVKRMQSAYDSVKSFQQVASCRVARNLKDTTIITFRRPATLFVSTDETLDFTGGISVYDPSLNSDGTRTQLVDGSRAAMPSLHAGIEKLDGFTHAGVTVVPLLLTQDKQFDKRLQGPKILSLSTINGWTIYELLLLGPHTLSLFIDAKTLMVVRTSKALDTPLVIDFEQPTIDRPLAKVMYASARG